MLRQRHYTALSWNDRFQQLVRVVYTYVIVCIPFSSVPRMQKHRFNQVEYGRVNRHFRVPVRCPSHLYVGVCIPLFFTIMKIAPNRIPRKTTEMSRWTKARTRLTPGGFTNSS